MIGHDLPARLAGGGLLGALGNAAFALFATGMAVGVPLRFAVGFCLAGVYPLGMKLVVSWVPERAGAALAQLVGMLTLGTALPHGIRLAGAGWSWQATILVSSALALLAAGMISWLGDGPHLKRRHDAPPPEAFLQQPGLRRVATVALQHDLAGLEGATRTEGALEFLEQRLAHAHPAQLRDADALYDSAAVAHGCRWALPLPGPDATRNRQSPLRNPLMDLLQAVPSDTDPGSIHDDDLFRISIAGAQEKTALSWIDGRWCLPHGATPTTHIMKLPLGTVGQAVKVDMSTSVENEWLCASILRAYGLDVAPSTMGTFEDQKVLIVERFDARA